MKKNKKWVEVLIYLILTLGSVITMIPFFWMLSTALKEEWQIQKWPPQWIPNPARWDNFLIVFSQLPFGSWFMNTLFITAVTMAGTLLSSTMVAYGFARYRAPARQFWFISMLATMMIPWTVMIIPQFFLFKSLGWINTFLPLMVPSFFGTAFYIFLLRQFFLTIPIDMEEAAKIDGAGTIKVLMYVLLPMVVPVLITVGIFQFNSAWNDFLHPLIYLNRSELYTLSLGINFFKSDKEVQWNLLMAASIVTLLPSLVLFFVGQKYFVQGVAMSGVKG
ncbi:carbohydrate ABC transporter permease [Paenibacillus sp. FSL H8-0034]|uniref:carbohydrate ABC transporter permease n=1 Tax=Paenibacillus sp. FSL H8-0034 TaxID=2954671 RepID=UPI0030F72290